MGFIGQGVAAGELLAAGDAARGRREGAQTVGKPVRLRLVRSLLGAQDGAQHGALKTQAKTKYLRTVSTTSQVPFMPGSITNTSPAFRCTGCSPSGVMMQ